MLIGKSLKLRVSQLILLGGMFFLTACGYKTAPVYVETVVSQPKLNILLVQYQGDLYRVFWDQVGGATSYLFGYQEDKTFHPLLQISADGSARMLAKEQLWKSFRVKKELGVFSLELVDFQGEQRTFLLSFQNRQGPMGQEFLPYFERIAPPALALEKKQTVSGNFNLQVRWQPRQINPVTVKGLVEPSKDLILFYTQDSSTAFFEIDSRVQKAVLVTKSLPVYARFQDVFGNLSSSSNTIQ